MVSLTFYGGLGEIGGTKILLEDGAVRLFLDFGLSYSRYKRYFEEYLKPRAGAGLLDLLRLGIVPPVEGIYREDIAEPALWQRHRAAQGYRKLEGVDGILLTHAHFDHSGHISLLRPEIPVYSTAMTCLLCKAIQDSGKSDLEHEIALISPRTQKTPSGWRQRAFLSAGRTKVQRSFAIADRDPQSLGPEAHRFWVSGFWPSPNHTVQSRPLAGMRAMPLHVRCFPVDHSIPGACAWAIETSAGWVVYSGDLRLHGDRSDQTRTFVEEASKLEPALLLLEGTNVDEPRTVTEAEVEARALECVRGAEGLVIADFSARDLRRLGAFLRVATATGRRLVVTAKDAFLLKAARLLDEDIPDLGSDEGLLVYQETTAKTSPDVWQRGLYGEHAARTIVAAEVSERQEELILCFSFFDVNELPSIRPRPGSLYLYSSSEPHDEEQEIDFRRLHAWLDAFGFRTVGLPIETSGGWEIPLNERGLHASGHAYAQHLREIVRTIRPKLFVPVHTLHPESYRDAGEPGQTEVRVLRPNDSLELG